MSFLISPYSEIKTTPYKTTVTTVNYATPVVPVSTVTPLVTSLYVNPYIEFDTGLNDNYLAQKEMTKWFLYRILDKWLYDSEMSSILKYLKISGNDVKVVSSKKEYDDNKVSQDSSKDIEKKADWIEDNIFNMSDMRSLLKRFVEDADNKWYNLPYQERTVVDAVRRTLKKKLKEKSGLE